MAISVALKHNAISYQAEHGGSERVSSIGSDTALYSGDNLLESRLGIPQSGMRFIQVSDSSARQMAF
jgi:hypothetical protein